MTAQRWLGVSMLLALLLVGKVSNAQVLTGALLGTVKDESGGVLPNASVHVTSSALIGGPASTLTNEKGQFRFASLPAGEYTLAVDLASFAPYHEDDISIEVQGSAERTVILKVGSIAESISVEAGTIVDQQRTGVASRFGQEALSAIRLSRTIELARKTRIELLLDVFNAFNSTAEERLADDNLFSQNFGRPSVFVDPRRAMLGVRWSFSQ
jgi:hypothetical protein